MSVKAKFKKAVKNKKKLVPAKFEPATSGLVARRANH